jgi:YHS domain-containing protein
MDFLARAVRYLFWLLVVSWSAWLLKKALGWMVRKAFGPEQAGATAYGNAGNAAGAAGAASAGQRPDGLAPRKLVRDPVCGVYLAEVLAIPLRDGGELRHFCSTACRDKFAVQVQRKAANA